LTHGFADFLKIVANQAHLSSANEIVDVVFGTALTTVERTGAARTATWAGRATWPGRA
jgi:hypothetical protein